MTLDVRPARPEDARGIAEVHVRAWQEAYPHLVPPAVLARVSVEQRELRWTQILDRPDLDVAVATDEGTIVGFASGSSNADPLQPRDRELESIYLLADQYGSGLGRHLLDAVIGDRPAFLLRPGHPLSKIQDSRQTRLRGMPYPMARRALATTDFLNFGSWPRVRIVGPLGTSAIRAIGLTVGHGEPVFRQEVPVNVLIANGKCALREATRSAAAPID